MTLMSTQDVLTYMLHARLTYGIQRVRHETHVRVCLTSVDLAPLTTSRISIVFASRLMDATSVLMRRSNWNLPLSISGFVTNRLFRSAMTPPMWYCMRVERTSVKGGKGRGE